MEGSTAATAGAQVSGAQGATENANGAGQAQNEQNQQNQQEQGQERTYTAAELQAETDRRVQAALATAEARWRTETGTQLQQARDEAARLAQMSADERAAEERRLEQERFNADKQKFEAERLEFEAGKQLADRELSPKFARFLAREDADTTKTNIEDFAKEWADALQKAVDSRLRSEPPKSGSGDAVPANAGFMDIIRQNQR